MNELLAMIEREAQLTTRTVEELLLELKAEVEAEEHSKEHHQNRP